MLNGAPPSRGEKPLVRTLPDREPELDRIRVALDGLRYGEVRVTIHDGLIVQIDRTEKQRVR